MGEPITRWLNSVDGGTDEYRFEHYVLRCEPIGTQHAKHGGSVLVKITLCVQYTCYNNIPALHNEAEL